MALQSGIVNHLEYVKVLANYSDNIIIKIEINK